MDSLVLQLYFRAILLIIISSILFGWLLPALISANDWVLTIIGLLGLLVSAPVASWYFYAWYKDVVKTIKSIKEEK